jgi:hypothetical protein
MPPKGHISKDRRKYTHIYSLAILSVDPCATQEDIREWVDSRPELLTEHGLERLGSTRANIYIREIQAANNGEWLESPWNLGIFAANKRVDLEFPHDQLPVVMAVSLRVFAGGKRLTARQATWVARLNGLLKENLDEASDGDIQYLYILALHYSAREITAAVITTALGTDRPILPVNHESDTWDLDLFLASHGGVQTPLENRKLGGAFDNAINVGLAPAVNFGEPLESGSNTGAADTEEVSQLNEMIREAAPTATSNWRTLTYLLMNVRAEALLPRWQEWTRGERMEFIRELADPDLLMMNSKTLTQLPEVSAK